MAVAAPLRRHLPAPRPLRILTAVPLCDGHDSAIMTINHELVRHGAEVVYLGYNQAAANIARAAVQEDVHAIGLSSYNGGHVAFFREVLAQLRKRDAHGIPVFGGGGGTILPADERALRRSGVARIFAAGTSLVEIVRTIGREAKPFGREALRRSDAALARAISLAEADAGRPAGRRPARATAAAKRSTAPHGGCFVLGVAGAGGAGKSTLIDELTARFLRGRPGGRIAILANDPSHADSGGALLGDRVSAIYSQDERVFFRSLATRGSRTGLAAAVPATLTALRRSGEFDLIVVESIGVGQDSDPFGTLRGRNPLADAVLFVTSPHYGSPIQLEKIALLRRADLVVLNKCDDPRSLSARGEIATALRRANPPPSLHLTTAARHEDRGVDLLYAAVADLAGFEAAGGERTCYLELRS